MVCKIAVIFAAGLGSRMQSLTKDKPKALVQAFDGVLLDQVIRQLAVAGIEHIIINTHYKSQCVIDHLQSRDNGIRITIVEEPKLLETGGSLVNLLGIMQHSGPIITCNVDTVWVEHKSQLSQIKRLIDCWGSLPEDKKLLMLVSDRLRGAPAVYDFELKGNRLIYSENAKHHYVGSQILEPAILEMYTDKEVFSLSEVYHGLADESGRLNSTYAIEFDGLDIFHVGDESAVKELAEYYNDRNAALNG